MTWINYIHLQSFCLLVNGCLTFCITSLYLLKSNVRYRTYKSFLFHCICPVDSLTCSFLSINSNTYFPLCVCISNGVHHVFVSAKGSMHLFLSLRATCFVTFPSVPIMKHFFIQFSSPSCFFPFLRSKLSLQHPILKATLISNLSLN
jgi:hypothetical protein